MRDSKFQFDFLTTTLNIMYFSVINLKVDFLFRKQKYLQNEFYCISLPSDFALLAEQFA
jgi:hypothetical protein